MNLEFFQQPFVILLKSKLPEALIYIDWPCLRDLRSKQAPEQGHPRVKKGQKYPQ